MCHLPYSRFPGLGLRLEALARIVAAADNHRTPPASPRYVQAALSPTDGIVYPKVVQGKLGEVECYWL